MRPRFNMNRLASGVDYSKSQEARRSILKANHLKNQELFESIKVEAKITIVSDLERFEMNLKAEINRYKSNPENYK